MTLIRKNNYDSILYIKIANIISDHFNKRISCLTREIHNVIETIDDGKKLIRLNNIYIKIFFIEFDFSRYHLIKKCNNTNCEINYIIDKLTNMRMLIYYAPCIKNIKIKFENPVYKIDNAVNLYSKIVCIFKYYGIENDNIMKNKLQVFFLKNKMNIVSQKII